ncbi:uncharacterized protein ABDE67_002986 [Symphorus nematophorus]
MAQFVHLSLLLAATIQLPLVSGTSIRYREGTIATFKFHQECNITRCCRGDLCESSISSTHSLPRVNVNKHNLTIYSLTLHDSGNYTCYCDSRDILTLNLTVTVTKDLRFHTEAKPWFIALEHCQNQSGSLVEIPDSEVQRQVKSLLENQTSSIQTGVWIGLERSIFGGSVPWKWISGSRVGDTDQWNSTFPVDCLNNHCGKIIRVNGTEFKWLDAWCHEKLPFICQVPAPLPSS